ncbi:type II toxin-antitoxin system Phd/YefM family antitoxin [Microbacterium sp.]|uniref:type II toxin-antitoxin system Phd/YefM family antitoxin n=1 Tax=Microbacterium sp. TaxID=51671 RepID=UPI0026383C60|nr:type II toxin-antitoxin system prevent-host-death family antitoxin [Microbacterium sp.]
MNVGIRELRDSLSRYLTSVRDGGELTVTDHGKPIARIIAFRVGDNGIEKLVTPTVLRELRARAERRGVPVEDVLSELAERGLEQPEDDGPHMRNGIPIMRGSSDHVVTSELVAAFRDDL